jgi:hypothetical protein
MSRAVYSTLFIEASIETLTAQYVVPDGMTAVVRDICVCSQGSETNRTFGAANDSTGVYFFFWTPPGTFVSTHWEGRKVIPGGSIIGAHPNGDPFYVSISGYLLTAD